MYGNCMRALVMMSLVGCVSIRDPGGPDHEQMLDEDQMLHEERVLVESECGRAGRSPLLYAWADGERMLMSPPEQYDDLRVYVTNTARWSACVASASVMMLERCKAPPSAPVMDGELVTVKSPDGSTFRATAIAGPSFEALLSYYDAMAVWAFCVQEK